MNRDNAAKSAQKTTANTTPAIAARFEILQKTRDNEREREREQQTTITKKQNAGRTKPKTGKP